MKQRMCLGTAAVGLTLAVIAAGGGVGASEVAAGANTVTSTHSDGVPRTSSSTQYRLVQHPASSASAYGFKAYYAATGKAKKAITMEMYELADVREERALAGAAARGVKVQVLLDKDFNGGTVNKPAYRYLRHHGVQVRWAPAGYIFHIKATTFDKKRAFVSSANLTSRYYATTRDVTVIDTNRSQVKAIVATFAHDYRAGAGGRPAQGAVAAPGLVWSPATAGTTAETRLVEEISSARRSVDFMSEELSDRPVVAALAAAARRGVVCRVVMTRSSEWSAAFATVTAAGCRVHVFPDSTRSLYIHEKVALVDAGTASASVLLGSQNASYYSLTRNRELSLLLTAAQAPALVGSLAATFNSDYSHAAVWSPSPSRQDIDHG